MARDTSSNHSVNITQVRMGSVITGNMKSKHSIRIDGYVTGDIVSEEKIIVGIHGEIGGNISGADITIEGYVEGDAFAKGTLHLAPKAVVSGRIFSKEISIEKGAQLSGEINVGSDIEIPEVDSKEVVKPVQAMQASQPVKKQASGDNYGTVAW